MNRVMSQSSFSTFDSANGTIGVRRWDGEASSPSCVLIHGVDGSSEAWATVATGVAGRRALIAIDLRGRGGASMQGPWGVDAHAADVAEFLATLDGPVTLVGHSFGGHVAARVAADRPDLVDALVLVDGGPPRLIPESMTAAELADGALSNIVPNLEAKGASVEAVTADFHSMVGEERAARPIFDVAVTISLLRAELGVAPTLPPVVPDAIVTEMRDAGLVFDESVIGEATHFSVLGDHSSAVVEALTR